MDAHLRLDDDAGGPVVVKTAARGAEARLAAEAARLTRAVHPGVVAALPSPPTEIRTRYAGEPVTAWTGPVTRVAGLGAAVATTLADLHDIGLVHGRLDATHILLGDDGRPRLCGFAPPTPMFEPSPADDVAALGAILADLLERATGDRRGGRGRRWWRTARSDADPRALLRVIDRAVDGVPTRRPTARALADALLAAVPAADLPTPEPDTLDRIWPFRHEETDEQRWAAVFGDAPPDLPTSAPHVGKPSAPPPKPSTARARATTASLVATTARLPHPSHTTGDDPSFVGTPAAGVVAAGAGADRRMPGRSTPRHNATTDQPARASTLSVAPTPAPDTARARPTSRKAPSPTGPTSNPLPGPAADDPAPTRTRQAGPASATPSWPGADDLTRERPALANRGGLGARAAGQTAATSADAPARRTAARRVLTAVAAVGMLVAALVVGGAMVTGSGGDAAASRPGPTARRSGCPPVAPPAVDVDGDGCPETVAIDGATVTVGPARWTLGDPGDQVAVGDWDCHGGASPALLRPATGDVFVFSGWADADVPVTVNASRQVAGAVAIRAGPPGGDGCDTLVVDLATGGTATVEVAR